MTLLRSGLNDVTTSAVDILVYFMRNRHFCIDLSFQRRDVVASEP